MRPTYSLVWIYRNIQPHTNYAIQYTVTLRVLLGGDWTQKCHREGAQWSGLMFE